MKKYCFNLNGITFIGSTAFLSMYYEVTDAGNAKTPS